MKSGIDLEAVVQLLKSLPNTREHFKYFDSTEIVGALARGEAEGESARTEGPRVLEFDRLESGNAIIGSDDETSPLYATTLPPGQLDFTGAAATLVRNVAIVHRLREVTCLYGFTRLEPAPTAGESELDEIQLAVSSAELSSGADWLPAMKQHGESIFLSLDGEVVDQWRTKPAVDRHARTLKAGETRDAHLRRREVRNLAGC